MANLLPKAPDSMPITKGLSSDKKGLLMSPIDLSDNPMKRSSPKVKRQQEPQGCYRKEP
jgi:hypothetical protein